MKKLKTNLLIFFLILISVTAFAQNKEQTFNWKSGSPNSDTLATSGWKLGAVYFPDTLQGTQIAVFTSTDPDSAFRPLIFGTDTVKIAYKLNGQVAFDATKILSVMHYVYFETRTAVGTPVNQTKAAWSKVIFSTF